MHFRLAVVSLFVAILAAAPAQAAGNLPIKSLHLDSKTANYEIAILYPQTGNAAVDRAAAAWAKRESDEFIALARDKQPGETPWTLDISYTVTRNDSQMFEALFEYDTYTGGAHPNHELYTLNFLLPDGAQVFLPEIVGRDGIARVSELATKNLIEELTKGDQPTSDADTVRMGAGPYADNFAAFTVTKDSLILYLQEYQVAPYVAGPQQTEIPLSKLRTVLRDDWRTPMASFDCAKALTPIEKAICADVTLARLDRQLAESYSRALRYATDQGAQNRVKDQQRQFIVTRDASCATQTDVPLNQCLSAAYRARQKVLDTPPM